MLAMPPLPPAPAAAITASRAVAVDGGLSRPDSTGTSAEPPLQRMVTMPGSIPSFSAPSSAVRPMGRTDSPRSPLQLHDNKD